MRNYANIILIMNAYYIDTYSRGHLHEMYNASSLLMFSTLYNHIEYRAEFSSFENVKKILKDQFPHNIQYKKLHVEEESSFLKRVIKQFYATLFNCHYILWAKKGWDVVINYNTAMSLRILNNAAKLSKARRIMIVCHGEMYDLVAKRKTSPLFKWGMSLFKDPHTKIAGKLYFATLSESINMNVNKFVSNNIKPKLISFDHTAIFTEGFPHSREENGKLLLGIVGGLRESKGLKEFFTFAELMQGNPLVEIRVIGHIENYRSKLESLGVVIPSGVGEHVLSREVMYDEIKKLDYVLYFFNANSYGFTASGSVFDAIECEKPIIALRNDYFEDLFKNTGGFGYLTENVNEMAEVVDSISRCQSKSSYNIAEIKKYLSPLNAALRFLKKYKWID